jgi:O-antigen ligase
MIRNVKESRQYLKIALLLVVFLKPISDMFYQSHLLDIVLLALVGLLVILRNEKIRSQITEKDYLLISVVCYYVVVIFVSNIQNGFVNAVKCLSIIGLYLLGELYYSEARIQHALIWSYRMVVGFQLFLYLSGRGWQEWTTQNEVMTRTFVGSYYFKTDLAMAMIQALIVFLFVESHKHLDYLFAILALYFVFISNSRAYFAFSFFTIGVYLIKRIIKRKVPLKVLLCTFLALLLIAVVGLKVVTSIPSLADKHYFSFASKSDLEEMGYGEGEIGLQEVLKYNTNYRYTIWQGQIEYFSRQSLARRLFGCGNNYPNTQDGFIGDAHSLYIAVLVNGGYVGMLLVLFLIIDIIRQVFRIEDVGRFYLVGLMIFSVLFIGVSIVSTRSTQCTWIPALLYGSAVGQTHNDSTKVSEVEN